MTAYNNAMHERQFGESNWANQMRIVDAEEEANARPAPPQRRSQRRPPPRRGPPAVPKETKETPPKDEQLYIGNGRGSKPVKKTLGQNFDCAGFIPLVRQVYDRICMEDQRIPRSLPFPIFQHAMTEFLVAYQLHYGKYVLKIPSLQTLMDPLAAISAEELNIPVPIYEYICGFSPTVTPTGDKVFWNLPPAAIPRASTTLHNRTVRPGSFGEVNAERHNAYECYVSPFITSEYIRVSCDGNNRSGPWEPFPQGWFPANGVPNENLLGYRPREQHHPDAIRKMLECSFDESNAITGRMCHSACVMTTSSGVLGNVKDLKICKADFKAKENSAAFIFKEFDDGIEAPETILWDTPSTLKSPFLFSASASNRANFMAYKRKRSEDTPGTCYLVNDDVPEGWNATRNHNFDCLSVYALQTGFRDRASLRDSYHEEEEGVGTTTQDVFIWLDATMIKK